VTRLTAIRAVTASAFETSRSRRTGDVAVFKRACPVRESAPPFRNEGLQGRVAYDDSDARRHTCGTLFEFLTPSDLSPTAELLSRDTQCGFQDILASAPSARR